MCQGFGDAQEDIIRSCGLEVVGEETWIDQIWDKFEAQSQPINLQDSKNMC